MNHVRNFVFGLGLFLASFLAWGCSLAPEYRRPAAPVPEVLGALNEGAEWSDVEVVGLVKWEDFLPEERLRALIKLALEKNRDLKLAGLKILEARAEFGLSRSERWPKLEGELSQETSGGSKRETEESYEASLMLPVFEIDYLNRLGHLERGALERYLGTIEAGRYAKITLVSSVAGAYLENRLAEERVKLMESNLNNFRVSRAFVEERIRSGQADLLELEQARGLVAYAEAQLEGRKAELIRSQNELAFWLGDFESLPLELPRAWPLLKWPRLNLPEGLRSEVLLNRPDVMEAERALIAANANIGAARAAFFPSIGLTGSLGLMGLDLASLFRGGGDLWSFGPRITIPIFTAGRNRANLDLAEIRKDMAIVDYEMAIQKAFREVAEGLSLRERLAQRLKAQSNYLGIQRRVLELASNRYQNGVISYLEVLEAQRSVLEAELDLLEIKKDWIFNDLALFAALGGGFPREEEKND
ncbi:MAG: efflux transporter outer membrane subunit [Deltaproteobacteria bacterium]|jgi:Cu(I)/Ag(I) efflux system outer membrane protein|nr:efflux transporter outer membrane subunit [Deltaproteobacteria bacterium]